MKTSFEISAASSNYHVMNENVRNRAPFYTNKNNRSLATCWPKVKKINSDTAGYEKKCARNKTRIQKSKKQTPKQSSIRSYLSNATSSSTSNLQNNPSISVYFSGIEFLSEDEEFDPTFIHKVIPTDISLETLTFVAIPC